MKTYLQNLHVTRFGSPLSIGGALYGVLDLEGLFRMDVDMKLAKKRFDGIPINREVESRIKDEVQKKKSEYNKLVSQIGVPEVFRQLFSITKKAEVEQFVRQITISEYDLFLLIHNCSQIGYSHRSKFKQYIPEHAQISKIDRDNLSKGNPKILLKKIHSELIQRKYLHVHLFEYSNEWHCFYFTHQDIEPASNNHWKNGSHLHYVSHLWSGLKKRFIWSKFNTRSIDIPDRLHIRFDDFKFPDHSTAKKGGVLPWQTAFDPNFASGYGNIALPVPHLTTRGVWFIQAAFKKK